MNRPPLKILITDPHLKGGGQVRYVTNLARELGRLGHAVTIGCRPGSILVERAREIGCAVHPFAFRGGLRPRVWIGDLREASRFIRTQKPDVLHVSGSQDHWTLALANKRIASPCTLVRTRHNTYVVKENLPNRILNRHWTDYQIVVCHTVCQTLGAQSTFDAARMTAIHNGVDADQFRPDAAVRERARAELGYAPDDFVCGIAARLVEAKGHEFLFRAAALLRPEFPNLRLLVIGEGEKELALRQLAKRLDIDEAVKFAGFKDNVAFYVQAFDIGVQPSIDCDTSSFSLKEQMAAEKPVIASDYGGLTEIIDDGVEGRIVPARSVEPLAEAIRALLQNPERCVAMGKAGRQRVLREFTVQAFAARTAEAYYRAIEIHHERAAH